MDSLMIIEMMTMMIYQQGHDADDYDYDVRLSLNRNLGVAIVDWCRGTK